MFITGISMAVTSIETTDNVNPYWQSDYAYVHFSYFPPGNKPYEGKDIYMFGELTNYGTDEASKMIFNAEKGAYEKTLFLKQGFYNYSYVTLPEKQQAGNLFHLKIQKAITGAPRMPIWCLVYFRPFGGRV